MKKTAILITLFIITIISIPYFAKATVIELLVTIDSLTVPARAGMDFTNTRPNSQYHIWGGRISVVDRDNLFVESEVLSRPTTECSDCYAYMMKDNYTTVSFPYIASRAPYKVYPELKVNQQNTSTYCMADCTQINGGAGYYYTNAVWVKDTWDGVESNDESYCGNGFCPNASSRNAIAIPPDDVYTYYCASSFIDCDSAGTTESYYFRWPPIFTMN